MVEPGNARLHPFVWSCRSALGDGSGWGAGGARGGGGGGAAIVALRVAATSAAIEAKVRRVCQRSQRAWIERQSAGGGAAVQVWIWRSIGTSMARVMARAATMSRNPASSHQNPAGWPWGQSRARPTRALSRARGNRMAMGVPRLWIIWWPTVRKVGAESWSMVRLRENQVPQNTPITRANSTMLVAWTTRILIARSLAISYTYSKDRARPSFVLWCPTWACANARRSRHAS